jgi:type I restriction enzyme S subunit
MEKKNISDLPEGWTERPLREVVQINPRHPKALNLSLKVSFVPMSNVNESSWKLNLGEERELGKVRNGYTHFADGDVLFAKITPCMENGKAAVAMGLASGLGCGTTELHVIRPLDGIDPMYIYHFLHQERFRREAALNFTGSAGQLRVPVSFIQQSRIPLAPPDEQRRIVAKLEELLAKLDACQKRLAKIPVILKRFRQSVLAVACSGQLTADWRQENPSHEVGEELLGRALDAREAIWKSIDRKGPCPEAKLPNTENLPDLPRSWAWMPLAIVGDDPFQTVQTGPFGALLHKEDFTKAGVPVVAVGNLTGIGFSTVGLYFVSREKAEQLSRFDVHAGDVLFARSGATLGKVCVAPKDAKHWRMTGHILRVRVNRSLLLPEFCVYALRGSPPVTDQVSGKIQGTTRPGYNTSLLGAVALPIAPLTEQKNIVSRVESLFEFADQIEARYRKAHTQVDKLTQSILAKAFRGELVLINP